MYVPNPPLDHFLTALFAVEIVFVTFVLYDESQKPDEENNPLATFAVFLGICYAMISIVRVLSVQVAYGVNRLLPYLGLVSKPPIQGRVQMNKWQDQSWQLVVHASMTATEVYILTYDCPGLWSDSFLAWVPSPFINYKPSLLLKRFYIFQLVGFWVSRCDSLPWLLPSSRPAGYLDGDLFHPPFLNGTHQRLLHDVLPSHSHHRAHRHVPVPVVCTCSVSPLTLSLSPSQWAATTKSTFASGFSCCWFMTRRTSAWIC